MLNFYYLVDKMTYEDMKLFKEIGEELYSMTSDNTGIIPSFLQTCLLNINGKYMQNPLISFETACFLSLDLTTIESQDFQQFETYFWYVVLHWPTQEEQTTGQMSITYEEGRILKSILKLKKIQEENSYYVQLG